MALPKKTLPSLGTRGATKAEALPKISEPSADTDNSGWIRQSLADLAAAIGRFKEDPQNKPRQWELIWALREHFANFVTFAGLPPLAVLFVGDWIDKFSHAGFAEINKNISADNDTEIDTLVWALYEKAKRDYENFKHWSFKKGDLANKAVANLVGRGIRYDVLEIDIEDLLAKKLLNSGIPEDEAQAFAHSVTAKFKKSSQNPDALNTVAEAEAAADLVMAALLASAGSGCLKAPRFSRPFETPSLWVDRNKGMFPTAESFLRHHYGPRLGIDGDLTYAALGRIDVGLQTALVREFKGRRDELHALLPTTKSRTDARLFREFGYVPEGADRAAKLAALSRRKTLSP
jgi:hypothetical protein